MRTSRLCFTFGHGSRDVARVRGSVHREATMRRKSIPTDIVASALQCFAESPAISPPLRESLR